MLHLEHCIIIMHLINVIFKGRTNKLLIIKYIIEVRKQINFFKRIKIYSKFNYILQNMPQIFLNDIF